MKTYEVEVVETVSKTYTVEARSAREAREKFAQPSVWYTGLYRHVVRSVRLVRP